MVKLTVLYGPPKDPQAFDRYYRDNHVPLAKKVKGVRRFEVARVLAAADGGKAPYYQMAELYFDDMAALQQAMASPEGQVTAADLANFVTGDVKLMICDAQDLTAR